MSRIAHSLVGYDRLTERVAEEFDVSDAVLPNAKELARVPADDPDVIRCYPLAPSVAREFADVLRVNIDTARRDYFLEGFASVGSCSPGSDALAPNYTFADDEKFRINLQEWSVWIHNDTSKEHVKVVVARRTLDDYAREHGLKDHCAVIDLLNARIMDRMVVLAINRAIDHGRVVAGSLELYRCDLGEMLVDLRR